MTRNEFIKFCNDNEIHFKEGKDCGWPGDSDAVYVYGKAVELPDPMDRSKTVKFTSYLRVSHFEERKGMCYVRDCGWCEYEPDEWIKRKCLELRDSFKEEN